MSDALLSILAAQRKAFTAELPVPMAVRKDRLKRVATLLIDHSEAIAKAVSDDFGHRSREQSMLVDVVACVRQVKHTIKYVERWARPEKRKVDFPLGLLGAKATVEYQPKGVIGVISPWNFPVQLTIGPVIGAFAAGNRVMCKMSEMTPAVTALFEEVSGRYFDQTELAFVSGGPDVGQQFAGLPFDHLIFTGGTGIARHVMRAAAENLVPATLELGGKSPAIVGRSADIAQTTDRLGMGKMINAGQVCLAPDYLFVPREIEGAVIDGLVKSVTEMYPTLLANDDYTSVINERHRVRLQDYIGDARAKGAEVIVVNPANEDFAKSNGNKMPLHILRGVTEDMAVMQEEIFGPILPVMPYDQVDEAIDYVNAHARPLGLYYFGRDADEQRRVLDRTISGGVSLNDVMQHAGVENLPFGGIGPAGMGSYHGIDGFRTFSHAKAIYRQSRIDVAKLAGFKPPYGKVTAKTIAGQLRF